MRENCRLDNNWGFLGYNIRDLSDWIGEGSNMLSFLLLSLLFSYLAQVTGLVTYVETMPIVRALVSKICFDFASEGEKQLRCRHCIARLLMHKAARAPSFKNKRICERRDDTGSENNNNNRDLNFENWEALLRNKEVERSTVEKFWLNFSCWFIYSSFIRMNQSVCDNCVFTIDKESPFSRFLRLTNWLTDNDFLCCDQSTNSSASQHQVAA